MDTTGVQRGIRSLDELAARGPKVERSLKGIEAAASDAGKGVSNLGASNAKGLDDVARAGDRAAEGLGRTSQAARSAVSSQQALAAAVAQFTNAERSYVQSLVDEAKQLSMNRSERAAYLAQSRGMSVAAQEVAAAVGKKIDAYKQEQAELAKTSRASQDAAGSMVSYAKAAAAAFIGSAVVRSAKEATLAMFEASAAADRLRTTLDFSTGGNSAREIEYLTRVTDRLGLQFSSTAKAYGQFQAAAKGTALEGEAARSVFESVAKASAVMGLSADNTNGVLLALQQMISKGTVQAEELRGQLGERLPGAFQIAARSMGVTTAELGKMLEQGQVVASDFLPKFAKALEENLGGAAEKAANRLDASVNRLDNAWERLKKNAGDSGFSQFVAGQYSVLADAMSSVSESIEDARASGGGFSSQLLAGAGAMAEFLNPLNAISYTAQSSSEQLRLAESRMVDLQEAAAKGINVQVQMGRLELLIKTLRDAKAARDELSGAGAPSASGDEIRAARSAEEARRRAAVNADIDKYLSGDARQTKGQIREEETTKAIAANAKLVQSVNERLQGEEKSIKLLQLRKALETEIANINEKHKDKTAGGAASLNDDIRAQVQGYRNADREILDGRKDFYAQLDLLSKTGRVGQMDAIRQSLTEEERVWAARKANFEAELAAAGKKKNSQSEVARITGQMQEAERDYKQKQTALTNELIVGDYKRAEAIRAITAEQREQIRQELSQAEVARDAGRKRGFDAVESYVGRAREDEAAARKELSLMSLKEAARDRAMAQYRVQIELAKELEKIDSNTDMSDPDKVSSRARVRAGAASASAAVDAAATLSGLKELDSYLDPARAQDFGSALRDAFGEAGNALAQLTNAFQGYAQQQAEVAKMQERLAESAGQISSEEYHKREEALAKKSAQSQIGSYASIAGAAKGFFSTHSKGYKAMEAAEKAFRVFEMALALESMAKQLFGVNAVTSATVTGEATKQAAVASGTSAQIAADAAKGASAAAVGVATQAQGDPYTAFPRMAAMAAAMAALGFVVGGFGGGGSSSAVREERQRTQGAGTVFGDAEAKSSSLGNAFEQLKDSAKIELRYQSGMLASLRNIEDAMAGVANAVLRTTGITSGNSLGIYEGILSTNKGDPILNAIGLGSLNTLVTNLPVIGGVIGKLQSLWGKTTQEITDSGLVINGIVAQLSRGEGFSQYTDVQTTKSSFFGLSKSTKESTVFGELDADTNEALGRVFRGLSSSLVLASTALGRDAAQVSEQIANTLIDIPRVSLRGLKGSDLQDAISSTISAAADTIGKTVVPGLDAFQKVGEGYFETLIRVSAGVESADYALERFGISAIRFTDVAAKQGDVAAEIFRDSVSAFEGAGKGITQIMQGITGTVEDLADTYRSLVDVRAALKSVGANGSDPTFDLLRGAGGLEALQDGLEKYLGGFFSETERYTAASARLAEKFQALGIPQPENIEAFRELASGLDQTDAASAALFGQLMSLAGAFHDVASAAAESERRMRAAYDDVAPDWLSSDELRAYRASRISEGLSEVGLSISAETLLAATTKSFQDLYAAIDKTTQAGRDQATALLNSWDAFKTMNADMNADLEKQKQAAADAQEAWERQQAEIAQQQVAAAQKIREAWKSITDTIIDEVKRIRGEMLGTGVDGIASAQAQFAIATTQARAGDEEAAKTLPTLSRQVLELAKQNARSALELKSFQAQIAASLLETASGAARKNGFVVPAFAGGGAHSGGWAMVGERGPELAYMPPARIYTASQTNGMLNQGELIEEVRKLREDARVRDGEIVRLHLRVAKALERWDGDGLPPTREEAAA